MTALVVRIFMRWAAAALVTHGILTEGDGSLLAADPDLAMMLEMGLGAGMAASAELWLTIERWWKKKVPAEFQGENV